MGLALTRTKPILANRTLYPRVSALRLCLPDGFSKTGERIMVGFKNRYMVMEVFLDPNRHHVRDDTVILTQFNVSKAIKDSILVNFGDCGLASSLGSFQRSIKACKTAALRCEESKFEQYKLMVGDRLSTDDTQRMDNYMDKIKVLEH